MKNKLNKIILASFLSMSAMGFMSGAHAAGTLAGTSITNTANLQFAIGGVAQTPKASNTVSFVVDRKINFILVEDNNNLPLNVVPGSLKADNVFKMKLTNLGNSVQDFGLGPQDVASGLLYQGLTDNFNTTDCQVRGDIIGGNGTYSNTTSANDAYVDEVGPDETRTVFVVCSISASQINNDFAVVNVLASIRAGGLVGTRGNTVSQTSTVQTAGVDTVFADSAGTTDSARDGVYAAYASYLVKSAAITISKTNTPLCDQVNFTTTPKNIPGAYIRYGITIANNATASNSAILGTITDVLNTANLTFDTDLKTASASTCGGTPELATGQAFKLSCIGGTRSCAATPVYKTSTNADSDGVQLVGSTITANLTTALTAETGYAAGELKAGESIILEFNAIVK